MGTTVPAFCALSSGCAFAGAAAGFALAGTAAGFALAGAAAGLVLAGAAVGAAFFTAAAGAAFFTAAAGAAFFTAAAGAAFFGAAAGAAFFGATAPFPLPSCMTGPFLSLETLLIPNASPIWIMSDIDIVFASAALSMGRGEAFSETETLPCFRRWSPPPSPMAGLLDNTLCVLPLRIPKTLREVLCKAERRELPSPSSATASLLLRPLTEGLGLLSLRVTIRTDWSWFSFRLLVFRFFDVTGRATLVVIPSMLESVP